MGCFSLLKCKKEKPARNSIQEEAVTEKLPPKLFHLEEARRRSLQSAPPSFKTRPQSGHTQSNLTKNRARALSAPSSLDAVDQHHLLSTDSEEQEEHRDQVGPSKDHRFSSPRPLPLPSPPDPFSALTNAGSFKLRNSNPANPISGPLPPPPFGRLRSFSFEEIATACQNFSAERRSSDSLSSTIYIASFGDENFGGKKLDATVFRLFSASAMGFKEFMAEVNLVASLQHPNLCKLLGFHAREGSDQRMLVYERLCKGSLDLLLSRKSNGPAMDWPTRMKVALCAARGLVFLHEEGPFQAMFSDFSTRNIQIDKDYTAKLSGHGCVSPRLDLDISKATAAAARLPEETTEKGVLTPKSNVWSFGVVLLELLTGRKQLDQNLPKEERNLVRWSRPYLTDDCRLSLIMDPRLKARFPAAAARAVADTALRCLSREPSERPTMRAVAESLERVQDVKLCRRFRLHEPGKHMVKFPSFNSVSPGEEDDG